MNEIEIREMEDTIRGLEEQLVEYAKAYAQIMGKNHRLAAKVEQLSERLQSASGGSKINFFRFLERKRSDRVKEMKYKKSEQWRESMKSGKGIPENEVKRIVQMHEQGYSVSRISTLMDRSKSTVSKYLKKHENGEV